MRLIFLFIFEVVFFLFPLSQGQKKTVAPYFLSKQLHSDLHLTACIALKEIDLLKQQGVDDGTMILPTDTAWAKSSETCKWFKALIAPQNADLRQELILEVATANPGEWEEFYDNIQMYPFIDASSGNVYFVDVETDMERPQLCLADWLDGDYQGTEECTEMRLPPISNPDLLGRQHIYMVDEVVLPEALRAQLDEASANYSCEPDEVPLCDMDELLEGSEAEPQTNTLDITYDGAIEHSEDYLEKNVGEEHSEDYLENNIGEDF